MIGEDVKEEGEVLVKLQDLKSTPLREAEFVLREAKGI